jgi:large subunit ribosomal protein L22
MEAVAKLRHFRSSPRKMNRVAGLVRNKKIDEALLTLKFSTLKDSLPLRKLLQSATANYKLKSHTDNLDDCYISEILVGAGPTYKRMKPRARGTGARILKRTCHVSIKVADKSDLTEKSAKPNKNRKNSVAYKDKKNDSKNRKTGSANKENNKTNEKKAGTK